MFIFIFTWLTAALYMCSFHIKTNCTLFKLWHYFEDSVSLLFKFLKISVVRMLLLIWSSIPVSRLLVLCFCSFRIFSCWPNLNFSSSITCSLFWMAEMTSWTFLPASPMDNFKSLGMSFNFCSVISILWLNSLNLSSKSSHKSS